MATCRWCTSRSTTTAGGSHGAPASSSLKEISTSATSWTGILRAGERLRVYVHLMDAGLGGADFLDGAVGTTWATEDPGKAVTETLVRTAESSF